MSRSYKNIRLKTHRVYSVEDLMMVYGVSRNTVSNWVQGGLAPSARGQCNLFRGSAVEAFHTARRARARTQLRPGEFKCLACKLAVLPDPNTIQRRRTASGMHIREAVCPECSARVFRAGEPHNPTAIAGKSDPNTKRDSAHEEKTSVPAGIGKPGAGPGGQNDAILYQWQRYAGKFSEKTLDRHLSAIRQFECFLDGKPFATLTLQDGHAFRDHLKASLKPGAEAPKSPSTVQHVVSHLKDFFAWLGKQKGYRSLPRDLPDALDMPRAVYAKALKRAPRPYPDLAEAEALLAQMPKFRVIDLRNRAIFALAFLGALRADALISLHLGDVDCATQRITQDGRASRTKNGKSLVIAWFPIPEAFGEAVCDWVTFMLRAGFAPEDALFPQERAFTGYRKASGLGTGPVPAMTSTHAVTHAFRVACRNQHAKYSPHAAKHTIAAERDKRALTAAERKAWSQNMGHENEQITDTHYGKLTDAQRFDLLETSSQHTGQAAQRAFTDAEKIALVDGVMKELTARGR